MTTGIGFGKNDTHNLKIFKDLALLHSLRSHILVGASRKSMIGRITNTNPSERLPGSVSLAISSLTKGVKFFRVHDVKRNKTSPNYLGKNIIDDNMTITNVSSKNKLRKYFGTDGIRGRANTHPMTGETALKVGNCCRKIFY